METIDLRSEIRSCSEHPLVYLGKKIKSLRKGEKIRVLTEEKIIPLGVIEIMASKHGAKLEVVRTGEIVEVIIYK